jgi:hypothetical protein
MENRESRGALAVPSHDPAIASSTAHFQPRKGVQETEEKSVVILSQVIAALE